MGKPKKPKPPTTRVTLYMQKRAYDQMVILAEKNNVTHSAIVAEAIAHRFEADRERQRSLARRLANIQPDTLEQGT